MKSIEDMRKRIESSLVVPANEAHKYLDAIEREVEERYIELPKDANGEPIRVGDALQGKKHGGGWCEPFNVIRMDIDKNGWEVYELGGYSHAPSLCLHKPPTIEELLKEYRIKYYALVTDMGITSKEYEQGIEKLTSEYAAKLQIKEEQS